MDKEKVKALEAAIKHWENDAVKRLEEDPKCEPEMTARDCALCLRYQQDNGDCGECPLNDEINKCGEDNSPFDYYFDDRTLENAREMVKVLKKKLKEALEE